MNWVNVAIQGILLGGLYALFAVGLALVFGVMRLVNLAHGDLGILAAFITLGLLRSSHLSLWPAALLSVVIMFVVGYVLQRGLLNFTLGTDDTRPIVVTFGLAIIIQNALLLTFSADEQGLDAGRIETASIRINSHLAIGWYPLLVFVLAVVMVAALQLFLNRSKLGRAFRATSDDREAAELMGMNNRHIYSLAMAVALGTVAIGGIALAIRTTFDPTAGSLNLIYAFEAVIMGGMGSLWGTLLGGVVLGLAQTLGTQVFGSGWGIVCGNVVFLIVLALRPSGFFARTVTA
ncbi:MAG: branched-chain amino acid ABC transporter permease [Thermoleophilia bacterium]|jgi:branched-chain amino acid transport system permease protein